jgi:hypothetical protein
MTATNKRLLISESRSNSNRCTPCREKPDQHNTYASHASPRFCGQSPYVATFHETPIDLDCSWEKGLLTQSTAHRLTDPQVDTQLLSRASQWSRGHKPSSCRRPTTRFAGPISPVCDRYVQYLLTGVNHRSLTDIGRGYNLGGASLPHTHSLTFPPSYLPFLLVAPLSLPFNQVPLIKPKCWV